MSQLIFSQQPGAVDLADATFDQDKPVTDVALKQLNQNAKFGMVRVEFFQGYYKNGETVALPVSPVDGYAYARGELRYMWSFVSPLNPIGETNGAPNAPTLDAESMQVGGGALESLEWFAASINNKNQANPGLVGISIRVNDGTTTNLKFQGVLYVTTIAERLSG